jgi:hypothetical protein
MRRAAVLAASLSLLVGAFAVPVTAREPSDFQVVPMEDRGTTETAFKSVSGRLAVSDPALLKRVDSARVRVLVKLDVDGAASYAGGVDGFEATSPSATGEAFDATDSSIRTYRAHVRREAKAAALSITAAIPSAKVGRTFDVAYGGLAVEVAARDAKRLLAIDGVAAVQADALVQPTDTAETSSVDFIGAPEVWDRLGGSATAGEGVVVGILDTGIWPEHPMLDDPGIDAPPGTFACEFGNGTNPLLGDAFDCNDKLIGAYTFLDTYMTVFDALPGEFCDNATGECAARDAEGHGTHTATTAAGAGVESAELFGVERGPVSGIAPGANLIAFKVCLDQGCFQSDSIAAVEQAIALGVVDVINFSIGGGESAFTDPVELAFLDAHAAGISVNASAGNSGPGASTAGHTGPWVTTVGASSYDHMFLTTLEMTADGGATFEATGSGIRPGLTTATDVVLPSVAGSDAICSGPFAPGSVAGKVVVCQRGLPAGRVAASYNVMQGGAAGMILFNPGIQTLFTDNFFVPTVMLEGPQPSGGLVAFLAANTGEKASWGTGTPTPIVADTMTSFSSRGPNGDFLKPDVTAPGIQILAGNTPEPHPAAIPSGPAGELYQAIGGTSMSSPHAAGVSALVKAAHQDWSPSQIKSALMTSSIQTVFKETGAPADPYDRGAGSIRVDRAVAPTVTLDIPSDDFYASASDPLGRVDLNLPSVQHRQFTGLLTTTRTVTNVSGRSQRIRVEIAEPAGLDVTVTPKSFHLGKGASRELSIEINGAGLANGTYFAHITLDPSRNGANDAVLPIAIQKVDSTNVTFSHSCSPTAIQRGAAASCVVEAQNLVPTEANVSIGVAGPRNGRLQVQDPTGAPGIAPSGNGFTWIGDLSPALGPPVEAITPGGSPAAYLSLSNFGTPPISGVSDESITNFNVPAFTFGGETYTRVGMVSNGYVVIGGGTADDVLFVPQAIPDPTQPNNLVAPLWTDLDPGEGGTMKIDILTDGTNDWLILEWEDVPIFGTTLLQSFQIWIGLDEDASPGDDITFAYGGLDDPGSAPDGAVAGVENRDASSALTIPIDDLLDPPDDDWTVDMGTPIPGGSVTIEYDAVGRRSGTYTLRGTMDSDVTRGTNLKLVSIVVN